MGYIYRINNNKKLEVDVRILKKEKSFSLRIFMYKLKVTIQHQSKKFSFNQFAFADLDNESWKIRKGHVDNLVHNISQMYNNYYSNYDTFIEKNGLTPALNNGSITDAEIRGYIEQMGKLKSKLDWITGADRFYVNDKYLNNQTHFQFNTFLTHFKSTDKMHPDVVGVFLGIKSAKHTQNNSFMKNNYEILRCDKTNIHTLIEPYFGYTIKNKFKNLEI